MNFLAILAKKENAILYARSDFFLFDLKPKKVVVCDSLHLTMSAYPATRVVGNKKRGRPSSSRGRALNKKKKNLTAADVKKLAKQMISKSTETKWIDLAVQCTQAPTLYSLDPLIVWSKGVSGNLTERYGKLFPQLIQGIAPDQYEGHSIEVQSLVFDAQIEWSMAYQQGNAYTQVPAVRIVVVRWPTPLKDIDTALTNDALSDNKIYGWADMTVAKLAAIKRSAFAANLNCTGKPQVEVIYDQKFIGPSNQAFAMFNPGAGAQPYYAYPGHRQNFTIDLTEAVKGRKITSEGVGTFNHSDTKGMYGIYAVLDGKMEALEPCSQAYVSMVGRMTFKEIE